MVSGQKAGMHTHTPISIPHLVDQLSPGWVGLLKDVSPELWILPAHQVAGLTFEQRILVANLK